MTHAGSDAHFSTEHLLTGLKARTVSNGIVTGLLQAVLLVMNLGSVMVLARLLLPQDFGLLAMVFAVMGFFRVFNEAGLSTATVQKEGITHAQVSNLFWTNVALGGVITLVLACFAPIVAWFYREPRLIAIILALSVTFLLTSLAVQHLALLKRQMRFKAIALIQIASTAMGIFVGIAMALLDYGYWSLVGMQLSTPVGSLLITWLICSWRPQFPVRGSGTWPLLSFGANLTASGFLWALAKGSDNLLIGRFLGSEALGLYSRAAALLNRPLEQAMGPLEAVFVPTFSRLQTQPDRYRRSVLQVYDVVAACGFLFSGLLLAVAHPMTLVVLGPKWESAAPIFSAFALVAVYVPITCVAGWLLTSQGRGKDFLRLSIIASMITVPIFLVSVRFGPVGVALSYSLSCLLIHLPVAFYIAGRGHLVTTRDLWSRFFAHLPLCVVVFSVTWTARGVVANADSLTQLCFLCSVGLGAGSAFAYVYPPCRQAAVSVLDLFGEWRKKSVVMNSA